MTRMMMLALVGFSAVPAFAQNLYCKDDVHKLTIHLVDAVHAKALLKGPEGVLLTQGEVSQVQDSPVADLVDYKMVSSAGVVEEILVSYHHLGGAFHACRAVDCGHPGPAPTATPTYEPETGISAQVMLTNQSLLLDCHESAE